MAPETDRDQAYSWPSKRDEELQTRLQAAVNSYKEWAEARDLPRSGRSPAEAGERNISWTNGQPQLSPPDSSPSSALSDLQARVQAAVDGYVSQRGPAYSLGLLARRALREAQKKLDLGERRGLERGGQRGLERREQQEQQQPQRRDS